MRTSWSIILSALAACASPEEQIARALAGCEGTARAELDRYDVPVRAVEGLSWGDGGHLSARRARDGTSVAGFAERYDAEGRLVWREEGYDALLQPYGIETYAYTGDRLQEQVTVRFPGQDNTSTETTRFDDLGWPELGEVVYGDGRQITVDYAREPLEEGTRELASWTDGADALLRTEETVRDADRRVLTRTDTDYGSDGLPVYTMYETTTWEGAQRVLVEEEDDGGYRWTRAFTYDQLDRQTSEVSRITYGDEVYHEASFVTVYEATGEERTPPPLPDDGDHVWELVLWVDPGFVPPRADAFDTTPLSPHPGCLHWRDAIGRELAAACWGDDGGVSYTVYTFEGWLPQVAETSHLGTTPDLFYTSVWTWVCP